MGHFPQKGADELLVRCHRRCCICHRLCGYKMELDHMVPQAESNDDDIENAIPACFECHAEIHCYNDRHSRGRKYHPNELRAHKKQWLDLCDRNPPLTDEARKDAGVGPIQALIDELEFNMLVAKDNRALGAVAACPFLDRAFLRALSEGAVSLLDEKLKEGVLTAYAAIGRVNQNVAALVLSDPMQSSVVQRRSEIVLSALNDAVPLVAAALKRLSEFLAGDG